MTKPLVILLLLISPLLRAALDWDRLPDLPDREGFAGMFAGIVQDGGKDYLVVGGGANFPGERPWEGGAKVYYDDLYLLPLAGGGEWRKSEVRLPVRVGYGMSVDLPTGRCLFMGGENGEGARDEVIEISMTGGALSVEVVVKLPHPITTGVAGWVDGQVLVGGGSDGERTRRELYRMRRRDPKWIEWEALGWPEGARGRMHAVAGVREGRFYLFGGRDKAAGDEEADERIFALDWLRDCWELEVATGKWRRLADLPEGRSAAPVKAMPVGGDSFLVLGGVTVPLLREEVRKRPEINGQGMAHSGFSREILCYHRVVDRWVVVGEFALEGLFPPVTAPVVFHDGRVIVPSGEIKPGVRSPQVLVASLEAGRLRFGWLNWVVVAVYLGGMVGIGYWFMKREAASSTEAYFRGGQRVPFWVAGLSIFATMLSAITFMAIPGSAYATNWNGYLGQWPILVIIPLVVFFYLPFYRRLNVTTAYEYLEKRFNVATRLIGSLTFMFFHLGRVAIVLYLPALALASVTDINVFLAIGVIGVLCVIYTVMGGIEAVVWTDAIQALVLIGGALLCFGLVVAEVEGGLGAIGLAMTEQGKGLTASWDPGEISLKKGSTSGFVLFLAFLMANLPSYTSGQDVVQRYVTTPSEKEAAKSLWMNIVMVLAGSAVFFALGTALFVFYQEKPELMDPGLPAKDGVLPFFIIQNLPAGVAGLIIAGVFAAAQSTISSSLNSVATAFVTDVYGRVWKPAAPDAARLAVAKRVVILLGGAGIAVSSYLAIIGTDEVFFLFNRFIGFALGPLGGLFALGVFTRRANGAAGVLAVVAGVLAVVATSVANEAGVIDVMPLLYGAIGFFTTLACGCLLGLVMRAKEGAVAGLTIWTQEK